MVVVRSGAKGAILAILIVTASIAGCIGGSEKAQITSNEPATSASTPGTAIEKTLKARPTVAEPATKNDWFVLAGPATPEGALTGFSWTVPPGAPITEGDFFGDEYQVLVLEMAPIVPDGVTIQNWALMVYRIDDGTATLMGALLAPTMNVRTWLAVLPDDSTQTPFLDPFYAGLFDVEENQTIAFVLAAQSSEPVEFGVAFRILDEFPEFDDEPAEDYATFREALNGTSPRSVERAGSGDGFQIGFYLDVSTLFVIGYEYRTAAIVLEDRFAAETRPLSNTREMTLSTSFESERGWALGLGLYYGDVGVGTWAFRGNARGQTLDVRSVIATTGTSADLAGFILFGYPLYFFEGDGGGPSETRYDMTVTNHGPYGHIQLAEQLDLGASLTELIGARAREPFVFAHTGLLGNVPPASALVLSHDRLDVVSRGGPTVSILGVGGQGIE